jgi:hypothetical protein
VPVIAGIATAFAAIAAVIAALALALVKREFLAHGLNGHRDLREAVAVHVVFAD